MLYLHLLSDKEKMLKSKSNNFVHVEIISIMLPLYNVNE